MAKPKEPSSEEKFVETLQDNNFADPEPEPAPRGLSRQEEMDAIRVSRAAERARRGPAKRRREVTNYHDAERLTNLAKAGHTHLATPEEMVDWEEAGLLPDPAHYYNSTPAEPIIAPQGSIIPPSQGDA
jgi:hypothetical protein